jgi:hypothetical protein
MTHTSPRSLHRLSAIAVLLILASCSLQSAGPTEQEIRKHAGNNCTMTSFSKARVLPQAANESRSAAVDYEAQCTPEGGKIARKVLGTLVFDEYRNWGVKAWSMRQRNLRPDPVAEPNPADVQTIDAKTAPVATAPTLPYSDGPECNGLVTRVVDEMVPCLRAFDPQSADALVRAVEQTKQNARLFGTSSNRNAALNELEESCRAHWRQVIRHLPSTPQYKACEVNESKPGG